MLFQWIVVLEYLCLCLKSKHSRGSFNSIYQCINLEEISQHIQSKWLFQTNIRKSLSLKMNSLVDLDYPAGILNHREMSFR